MDSVVEELKLWRAVHARREKTSSLVARVSCPRSLRACLSCQKNAIKSRLFCRLKLRQLTGRIFFGLALAREVSSSWIMVSTCACVATLNKVIFSRHSNTQGSGYSLTRYNRYHVTLKWPMKARVVWEKKTHLYSNRSLILCNEDTM